jgi:hypothetical protein
MGRPELIRHSLRAHGLAWLGLVPLLGVPFAIGAVLNVARCRRLTREEWNPAARYLLRAKVLVAIAMLLQLGAVVWLGTRIVQGAFAGD